MILNLCQLLLCSFLKVHGKVVHVTLLKAINTSLVTEGMKNDNTWDSQKCMNKMKNVAV